MVERAVHFGLQLAGVHVGQLEEIVPLTMETVVLGADAVVVAEDLLDLDAGQDGQKFVLGRKVRDVKRITALGVEVVFQLLGRGNDGEVDVRLDVDTGELETEVDGTLYYLKEKDLMIYGPGQFHTQYTDEEHRASYMTILFDMRNLTPVEREVWYDALINRVFHYDQKINTLLKTFVRESTTGIPYMNSLML